MTEPLVPIAASQVPPPPVPELLLSAIIDSSDDAIASKSLDGIITTWNRSAERIFGYTRAEAIGRPMAMLLPPDRLGEEAEILRRIRLGDRVDHFETIRRRKDGSLVEVSVTISPIRDSNGEIVGASKVARDITDQKLGDRAGLLLSSIVASSDDAILSKNLDGVITSWNAGAQRMFGYTAEETIGRSVIMLVPADRKEEEPKILSRLRRGERVDHFETLRLRKNGELFPVSLTISPIRDAKGIIIGASKIARDITEPKRIAAEREQLLQSERAARVQAEQANRMKDQFLATVSHELRTPLNAIVGWTEVLKEGGHVPDVVEAAQVIERNARAQGQLIEDLLDLGRVSSGKLTLDIVSVDIDDLVGESMTAVRQAAGAKNIELKAALNHLGGIVGDKRRLVQVLCNLLSNSIKFTPNNGRIDVRSRQVGSSIDIEVTDTGCGIAPDFLPHVFERFRQADSSTKRQYGGLGIGLALVKQLVELHGGAVRAESPGLGKGATFTVSLPARMAPPVSPTNSSPGDSEQWTPENLSGIKVLVVDDDTDSLGILKRVLSSRHADVQTATCMADGLTIFSSFRPDIVLSDIGMPFHDGYEFIRNLRQLPGGANIPAAALTALARAEDRMRALQAGYQMHLAKPIAPAEVVAVVRNLANLRTVHAS
jgi:PAS domain S-box-containing protein